MYSLNAIITRPDIKKELMDYINQEIINNPDYYTVGSIAKKVNEHIGKSTIDSISESTLKRLLKEEGIMKDKQKKMFCLFKRL